MSGSDFNAADAGEGCRAEAGSPHDSDMNEQLSTDMIEPEIEQNEEYTKGHDRSIESDDAYLYCPRCGANLQVRRLSEQSCVLLCENSRMVSIFP